MDKKVEGDLQQSLRMSMANKTMDLNSLEPDMREKLTLRNKWRAAIQKNLQNITKDLLVLDTEKTYSAEPKDLMKVLDRRLQPTTAMQ
jgi:hypothetical protein